MKITLAKVGQRVVQREQASERVQSARKLSSIAHLSAQQD